MSLVRNKCLFQYFFDLADFSHILFIDSDYTYSFADAIKIIFYERAYNKAYDIISGFSVFNNIFYDLWATRLDEHITWGVLEPDSGVVDVWSTYNGFCLYKIKPFLYGDKFNFYNERLKIIDCEVTILCEEFRKVGFKNIAVDTSTKFFHEF
ncbi:MAG: hypothetical protein JXA94_01075 [Parachlamydiales bacterium]|nr:hypothetical protein [Parachlamydiales bacterium]